MMTVNHFIPLWLLEVAFPRVKTMAHLGAPVQMPLNLNSHLTCAGLCTAKQASGGFG